MYSVTGYGVVCIGTVYLVHGYPVYLLDILGPSGSPPPNDMMTCMMCWCSSVLYILLAHHMLCRVYMLCRGYTVLSTMLPVVGTVLILGDLVI